MIFVDDSTIDHGRFLFWHWEKWAIGGGAGLQWYFLKWAINPGEKNPLWWIYEITMQLRKGQPL